MRSKPSRLTHLMSSVALLGLTATMVAGCQTASIFSMTASSGGLMESGSLLGNGGARSSSEPRDEDGWRREAKAAGERYRVNPKDPEAAMRYAEALRRTDQSGQAAAVLQQASISNPRHRRLLGAYGRALADAGQLEQAFDMLSHAHTPDQPDWRVLSAQGAVLDQMGRHQQARQHYTAALKIAPNEPTVLSNLGLSYVLSKNLKQAEATLRQASDRGGKDRRVRQNLALVIGLQGRFKEAENIVRADLPPAEAAENIAYLKHMLAQHEGDKARQQRQAARTAG